MIMKAFVFNIVCQIIPYISKNALHFLAISNLSVKIEFYSLKYDYFATRKLLFNRILYVFRLISNISYSEEPGSVNFNCL